MTLPSQEANDHMDEKKLKATKDVTDQLMAAGKNANMAGIEIALDALQKTERLSPEDIGETHPPRSKVPDDRSTKKDQ